MVSLLELDDWVITDFVGIAWVIVVCTGSVVSTVKREVVVSGALAVEVDEAPEPLDDADVVLAEALELTEVAAELPLTG